MIRYEMEKQMTAEILMIEMTTMTMLLLMIAMTMTTTTTPCCYKSNLYIPRGHPQDP